MSAWWEQRAADEKATATWRNAERAAAGLSPYLIHHEPAKRFQFHPAEAPTRRSLVRAYARAAALCRGLPGARPALYRRLMRQALDRVEATLRNQVAAKRRGWVATGCPRELRPWAVVEAQTSREEAR